jgi:hypothetical protein
MTDSTDDQHVQERSEEASDSPDATREESRDSAEGQAQVVEVAPDPEQTGIEVEKPPRADQLSAEELEEIRKERLDPDNRPDNVEVDNTQRTFDTTTGKFEDSDSDADLGPFEDPEGGSNDASEDASEDESDAGSGEDSEEQAG